MVDLDQELVCAVGLLRRRNEVAGGIAEVRLWEEVEDLRAGGIDGDGDRVAVVVKEIAGALGQRWDVCDARDSGAAAEAFVVQEVESPVLDDWPAESPAELIKPKRRLGKALIVKEVSRV